MIIIKKDKIFLTEEGKQELKEYIELLHDKLKGNSKKKSDCYEFEGDGWHDNFAFEEAKRQEISIIQEIEAKNEILKDVQIVNKTNDKNKVNVDDIIKLKLYFSDEDI